MCLKTEIVSQFLESHSPSLEALQTDKLVFEPLKGGGSAATLYRFNLKDTTYVLRLFPSQASSLAREHQINLAKQAGEKSFGPKIHFVDPEMKGMIMEFIPGRTVEAIDFKDNNLLAAFAKFLKRLHLSEVDFPLAVSPFKRFRDFSLKVDSAPPRFSEIQTLMADLELLYQLFPNQKVPSHLDLHPLNIMTWNEHFFLVDWVNGGMSDPYFDLATFSVFHELDNEKTLHLLTHYLERAPTELEWNRFITAQPVRLFVIAAALMSFGKLYLPIYQQGLDLIDQDRFYSSLRNLRNQLEDNSSTRQDQNATIQ